MPPALASGEILRKGTAVDTILMGAVWALIVLLIITSAIIPLPIFLAIELIKKWFDHEMFALLRALNIRNRFLVYKFFLYRPISTGQYRKFSAPKFNDVN
jgi:hypothetical protein